MLLGIMWAPGVPQMPARFALNLKPLTQTLNSKPQTLNALNPKPFVGSLAPGAQTKSGQAFRVPDFNPKPQCLQAMRPPDGLKRV